MWRDFAHNYLELLDYFEVLNRGLLFFGVCLDAAEFIHLLASESNEVLEAENKKTMVGDHVLKALEVELLFFSSFLSFLLLV